MAAFKIEDFYTHIYAGRILDVKDTKTGQLYSFGTYKTALSGSDSPKYALLSANPSKAPDRFFKTCPSPIDLWNDDLEIVGLLSYYECD